MTAKAKTEEQKAAEALAAKNPELTPAEAKAEAKEQAASEENVAKARAAEIPVKDDETVVLHSTGPGPLQDGNVLEHPAPRRGDPYAGHRKAEPEKKDKE